MNIKSEQQYKKMKKQLENLSQQREEIRAQLEADGLSETQIQIALVCINEMYESTKFDVEEYERVIRGDFDKETVTLDRLGSHLIKLRLWKGITQTELAKRLGVSQEQISKDERFDYQSASISKINRILQALGVEKLTILPYEDVPPAYAEYLKKQQAVQEISAAEDEISATKQAG